MQKKIQIIHNPEQCPIQNVLDRFGDKWSLLIIMTLSYNNIMRFNELHKSIGVSQKMLTVTLRTLEADGLVSRKMYPEIPPRVEYRLTKLGKSLVPHIDSLSKWAEENQSVILKSRAKFNNKRAKK
ncbi:MAG: helix-turn-helix domain-containing protein [Bacteroidota bacterium]